MIWFVKFISEISGDTKWTVFPKFIIPRYAITKDAEFSDVIINKFGTFETIVVVGGVGTIESKINTSNKQLLRG